MDRYTSSARHVIAFASEEAGRLHRSRAGTEHLLLAVIRDEHSWAAHVLKSMGVSLEKARQKVTELANGQEEELPSQERFSSEARAALDLYGYSLGEEYISTQHILIAIVQDRESPAAQVLTALGVEISTLLEVILRWTSANIKVRAAKQDPGSVVLDEFGENLTQSARLRGLEPIAVGRDREIQEVIQVLSRRTKGNPIIIGEPGIGRTAIVNGLAEAIVRGDVPGSISGHQVYKLDVEQLTCAERNIEANLNTIVAEIESRTDIILFIDEIHLLLGESSLMRQYNVADRMVAVLGGTGSRIIGASTLDDYRGQIEIVSDLHRHLTQVTLDELSISATIASLKSIRDDLEAHYRVSIENEAIDAAAVLARRYFRNEMLPESAVELLDKACARASVHRMSPPEHLKELDKRITAASDQKESEIDAQNFEGAAKFRDAEQKLREERYEKDKIWKLDKLYEPVGLDEGSIVEVVALEAGVTQKLVLASLHPRRQQDRAFQVDDSQTYVLLGDQPVRDVSHDLLGTDQTGKTIAAIICDSRASSPFVMAIDGGWGMGKSTLLHQISSYLSAETDMNIVQFNAWTSQGERALEGLIKSVLGSLDKSSLRRGLRRMSQQRHAAIFTRILLGVAARFVGATRLIDELWNRIEVDAKGRNELRSTIFNMLSDWTSKGESAAGKSLVVVIDDLDRCSDQVIIQICEAVKLYLDAPGLIFVIGCDYSALQGGISSSDRGNEARTYLEKIIQVVYRLQPPTEAQVVSLVQGYARQSKTSAVIDQSVQEILSGRAGRNPRRIKRIFNSFIMESRLNLAWSSPEVGTDQLVKAVTLHHLYPSFYDEIISSRSGGDPIGDFLDYAEVKVRAGNPPPLDDSWWFLCRRLFRLHGIAPPPRSTIDKAELSSALAGLESMLPGEYQFLARDIVFISLLKGIGDEQSRAALTSLLRNEPL